MVRVTNGGRSMAGVEGYRNGADTRLTLGPQLRSRATSRRRERGSAIVKALTIVSESPARCREDEKAERKRRSCKKKD